MPRTVAILSARARPGLPQPSRTGYARAGGPGMKFPRFSIAGLMALTALIALDCLATRVAWDVDDIRVAMLYFGELPWLNVLLIGLTLLRGQRQRGEPSEFLV